MLATSYTPAGKHYVDLSLSSSFFIFIFISGSVSLGYNWYRVWDVLRWENILRLLATNEWCNMLFISRSAEVRKESDVDLSMYARDPEGA